MDASFVIGFHTQRFDNLLQTLRFLVKDHADVVARTELVTVCQDAVINSNIEKADMDAFHAQNSGLIPIGEFVQNAKKFGSWQHFDLRVECMQLPVLTNFGVEKASSDKIILLESDRILPAGYFAIVIDQLTEGVQITTRRMLKLLKPTKDEAIVNNLFESKDETRSDSNEIGRRNMWSGNTAFMKKNFIRCGGMDTYYKGYGWADSDMTYCMESDCVKSVFREELELHLWHPSATYGEGDQKQLFINNGIYFCHKWKKSHPEWFRKEIVEHTRVLL